MTRLLIIGANGQVGHELRRTLSTLGHVLALGRNELDLSIPGQIRQQIQTYKPDIIINAAAYTAVDQAESDADTAMLVNGTAPGIIAEEAKKIGASMIHYSTDYVYDGSKKTPYYETDVPNPLSVYGKSKLAGEWAVQSADIPHLILRTSWVYGKHGKNFYNTIMRLAREREELRIVNDQVGCPTWSRTIAETTSQLIAQQLLTKRISYFEECAGVYNLVANGQTDWYHFAKRFLEFDIKKEQQKVVRLVPISSEEYPTPVKRPAYSVLSTEKISRIFNLTMPHWDQCIELISE